MPYEPQDPRSAAAQEPEGNLGLEAARKQVERILASDTLRAAEALKRMLRYLADKTFSGGADSLNEYSVGLDGVGKPSSYDPRHDSGVRLQASRLRQKLDEYYRSEGVHDSLIIELPKGGFKISYKLRIVEDVAEPARAQPVAQVPTPREELARARKWRNLALGLAATSLVLACIAVWTSFFGAAGARASSGISAATSPELELLWKPFVTSHRHLILAFDDPLFVRFQSRGGYVLFRKRGMVTWDDALKSPEFELLNRSVGNATVAKPSVDLVMRSDLYSIFALAQFFATHHSDVSVLGMSQLSWQQNADDDVILLGSMSRNNERQLAMPAHSRFLFEDDGVRNLKPLAGEPTLFRSPENTTDGDGDTLELVSLMPGPLGRTTTLSITCNRAWACFGAVQSMMDPAFAGVITSKLRDSAGYIPPYYQIVLRISYRGGTPVNSAYVTHRVIPSGRGTEFDQTTP